jgi:hypothetical protein
LKFLYLCFKFDIQLLFLCLICRRLHLVVDTLEELDAFGDFLQSPVNFTCIIGAAMRYESRHIE